MLATNALIDQGVVVRMAMQHELYLYVRYAVTKNPKIVRSRRSNSLLHLYLYRNSDHNSAEGVKLLEFLLQHGADPNETTPLESEQQGHTVWVTFLKRVFESEKGSLPDWNNMMMLLRYGANPDAQIAVGWHGYALENVSNVLDVVRRDWGDEGVKTVEWLLQELHVSKKRASENELPDHSQPSKERLPIFGLEPKWKPV